MNGGRYDRAVEPGVGEETDVVDPGDPAPVEETAGVARPHLVEFLSDEAPFRPHGTDVEEDAPLKRECRRTAEHLRRPDAPGEHPTVFDVDAEISGLVGCKVLDRFRGRLRADDRRHARDRGAFGGRPAAPIEVASLDHGGAAPDEVVLRRPALEALEVGDVEVPGRESG